MLNTRMRDAMKNEEPDMSQYGRKLNDTRAKLLKDLKTSINDLIPSEILEYIAKEEVNETIEEVNVKSADQMLQEVVEELFDMRLKCDDCPAPDSGICAAKTI